MIFRAVNGRCAADIGGLDLPVAGEEALAILARCGLEPVRVDLIAACRGLIGRAGYRRGARLAEAPGVFDCSSLVKWAYGLLGVWLPRRAVQQYSAAEPSPDGDRRRGDLVFVSGLIDCYDTDVAAAVGHVGILTGDGTVIHAANSRVGVVETEVEAFTRNGAAYRGLRRPVSDLGRLVTFRLPPSRDIETSDDLRWLVLQEMGRPARPPRGGK